MFFPIQTYKKQIKTNKKIIKMYYVLFLFFFIFMLIQGVAGAINPLKQLGKLAGEDDAWGPSKAKQGAVRDAIELVTNALINPGMPVPMEVGPQAGDPVEVAVSVHIDEVHSLCPVDDQGWAVCLPLSGLGEGVPDVVEVPLCEGLGVNHGGPPCRWPR